MKKSFLITLITVLTGSQIYAPYGAPGTSREITEYKRCQHGDIIWYEEKSCAKCYYHSNVHDGMTYKC